MCGLELSFSFLAKNIHTNLKVMDFGIFWWQNLLCYYPKICLGLVPFFSSWLGLPLEFGSPLTRRKNDFAWYDGHRSIDSFLKYLPPPQSNYLNYSLNPELNSKHSGLDMFTIFISGRICLFLRREQGSLFKLLSENLKFLTLNHSEKI